MEQGSNSEGKARVESMSESWSFGSPKQKKQVSVGDYMYTYMYRYIYTYIYIHVYICMRISQSSGDCEKDC